MNEGWWWNRQNALVSKTLRYGQAVFNLLCPLVHCFVTHFYNLYPLHLSLPLFPLYVFITFLSLPPSSLPHLHNPTFPSPLHIFITSNLPRSLSLPPFQQVCVYVGGRVGIWPRRENPSYYPGRAASSLPPPSWAVQQTQGTITRLLFVLASGTTPINFHVLICPRFQSGKGFLLCFLF